MMTAMRNDVIGRINALVHVDRSTKDRAIEKAQIAEDSNRLYQILRAMQDIDQHHQPKLAVPMATA